MSNTPFATYTNNVPPADVAADVVAKLAVAGLNSIGLWVDDDLTDRLAPDSTWVHVTTQFQAQAVLEAVTVSKLSLDNDLDGDEVNGQGKKVLLYLCDRFFGDDVDRWPTQAIIVHTANSAARDYMVSTVETYGPQVRNIERTRTPGGKPLFKLSPLN
jgi:hypothetical protein